MRPCQKVLPEVLGDPTCHKEQKGVDPLSSRGVTPGIEPDDFGSKPRARQAMEQLIFESKSSLLATAYKQQRKIASERLSHKELSKVIESYMVHWLTGDDQRSLNILLEIVLSLKHLCHTGATSAALQRGSSRAWSPLVNEPRSSVMGWLP